MADDEILGIREGQEIFLSYRDDNEYIVSGFFILIKLSETLLQVKSNQNLLVIPVSRVIKIKQRFTR